MKIQQKFAAILMLMLGAVAFIGCIQVDDETDITVTFSGATQTGGTSGTVTTTGLTLTFDVDPATLTADNITVTGATKGLLTGTGLTAA